jgi:hypothetical protein
MIRGAQLYFDAAIGAILVVLIYVTMFPGRIRDILINGYLHKKKTLRKVNPSVVD